MTKLIWVDTELRLSSINLKRGTVREVVRGMRMEWGEVKKGERMEDGDEESMWLGRGEVRREKGKMGGQEGEHRCGKKRERVREKERRRRR